MRAGLHALERVLEARFRELAAQLPGETPDHQVRFSPRITNNWALIYFRRRLIRFSPYLFLLDARDLPHGGYWEELDATLKHEVAHACLYHSEGEVGHTPEFHRLLASLGVSPNGERDLGPTNVAYRYVYRCQRCRKPWYRRAPLRGAWACRGCYATGAEEARMVPAERPPSPWERLQARRDLVWAAVAAGQGGSPRGGCSRRPHVLSPLSPKPRISSPTTGDTA